MERRVKTSEKHSRKKIIAIGTSGLMAMSLLIGSTTTAIWSDNTDLNSAEVIAGNLDIEKIGNTVWSEQSSDSANFGNEINLSEYRITPGDTIQASQKLDVALDGKNLRTQFEVHTDELSGELYSSDNGVNGTYMVLDENDFVVIPSTPLGTNSPEVILSPDDVTPEMDSIEDYTCIVTVSFDYDTPDRVRTRTAADLETMSISLNQIRDNLMQPLPPQVPPTYSLDARTEMRETIVVSGGTARFTHIFINSGNAPIIDLEVKSEFGTQPVIGKLLPGQSVRFYTEANNLTSSGSALFEFFGNDSEGNKSKLGETSQDFIVQQYSASVIRTHSSSTDPATGITSVQIKHDIINTSTNEVKNIVVKADGIPDSTISNSVSPGESVVLFTVVPHSDWFGTRDFEFNIYGLDAEDNELLLGSSTETIISGSSIDPSQKVAMADYHTCDIRNDGQVWCWGRGDFGALGDGTRRNTVYPVRAGSISNAVSLDADDYGTFAITSTGDLYAWGHDGGNLGLGSEYIVTVPKRVSIPSVRKISSNNPFHTTALLNNGTVRVTGNGSRIGTGDEGKQVFSVPSKRFYNAKDVGDGLNNSYVVDGNGQLWGTGSRSYNALNTASRYVSGYEYGWVRIGYANNIEKVFAGNGGGVYKTSSGEVWGWGRNHTGQLGIGTRSDYEMLRRLPHYENLKSLDYGWSHIISLKHDGTAWINGNNIYRDPDTNTGSFLSPHKIKGFEGNVKNIHASKSGYSLFADSNRYAWGRNDYGQLGVNSDAISLNYPQLVTK